MAGAALTLASLRIAGVDLEPDEISRLLGVTLGLMSVRGVCLDLDIYGLILVLND